MYVCFIIIYASPATMKTYRFFLIFYAFWDFLLTFGLGVLVKPEMISPTLSYINGFGKAFGPSGGNISIAYCVFCGAGIILVQDNALLYRLAAVQPNEKSVCFLAANNHSSSSDNTNDRAVPYSSLGHGFDIRRVDVCISRVDEILRVVDHIVLISLWQISDTVVTSPTVCHNRSSKKDNPQKDQSFQAQCLSDCYYTTLYCAELPFACTSSASVLSRSRSGSSSSSSDEDDLQFALEPTSKFIYQIKTASPDWVSTVACLCYLISILGVFTYRSNMF
uniref:Amino acid transporter transmembrane domain-containing protein n=1 Tax=Ditylenchus dipsaci TaxID=166011 RepID=A0A915DAC6_9BILA